MRRKFEEIAKFGRQVGMTDRAFTRLAIQAATGAARGEIEPEDASDVIREFNEARARAARQLARIDPPGRQQASKMRKIIEVGDQFGVRGVNMLKRAAAMNVKEFQSKTYEGKLKYHGEYNLLVDTARHALKEGRVLSVEEIKKLAVEE